MLWHFQNMKLAFEIGGDFVSKFGHFWSRTEGVSFGIEMKIKTIFLRRITDERFYQFTECTEWPEICGAKGRSLR